MSAALTAENAMTNARAAKALRRSTFFIFVLSFLFGDLEEFW
jgi:hypothetical protein